MRKLAVLLACLICIHDGQQVLPETQRWRSGPSVGLFQGSDSYVHRELSAAKLAQSNWRVLAAGAHHQMTALALLMCAFNPSVVLGFHHKAAGCKVASSQLPGRVMPQAPMQMSDAEEDSDEDLMDWREMRARLVAQERADQQETRKTPAMVPDQGEGSEGGYSYESPLIEQGSVLLSSTKEGRENKFAISQQYLHKSVILLMPQPELGTRGVILNRPTAYKIEGFPVWYGGPAFEGGIFLRESTMPMPGESQEIELFCLHTLEGDFLNRSQSESIIKGVSYTSLEYAKELIGRGIAKKSDFWLILGVCGWEPEQLQKEVDAGDWYLASVDSGTIIKDLLRQGAELPPASTSMLPVDGLATWETLMQKIGLVYEVKRTRGCFGDRMASEWCRMRLLPAELREKPEDQGTNTRIKNRGALSMLKRLLKRLFTRRIRKPKEIERTIDWQAQQLQDPIGMVLRAGSTSDRALLDEPFLHKSLLLVIREASADALVAVVLNRPTRAAVNTSIGLRLISFGGRAQDRSLGNDENGLLWFGQTAKLKPLDNGIDIGNSGLRVVPGEKAIKSLEDKTSVLSDYLVVAGVNLFSRKELERMLKEGQLTVVDDARPLWPQLFEISDPSDLYSGAGVSDGTSMWWAVGLLENKKAGEQQVVGELPDLPPTQLIDEALARWLELREDYLYELHF